MTRKSLKNFTSHFSVFAKMAGKDLQKTTSHLPIFYKMAGKGLPKTIIIRTTRQPPIAYSLDWWYSNLDRADAPIPIKILSNFNLLL